MHGLLIAAVIVFVLNAAGSFIEFNNRFVNALVDTVLFAIVFGLLIYFGYLHLDFSSTPVHAAAP
jgi:cell shape-determining protein MreD